MVGNECINNRKGLMYKNRGREKEREREGEREGERERGREREGGWGIRKGQMTRVTYHRIIYYTVVTMRLGSDYQVDAVL